MHHLVVTMAPLAQGIIWQGTSGGSRVGWGGVFEPRFESKLFHFHGELQEKYGKFIKSNLP